MNKVRPDLFLIISESTFITNSRSRWSVPLAMVIHFEMEVVMRQPCEICFW